MKNPHVSENLKVKQPRLTYIAFLECELRGPWEDWIDEAISKHGADPEDLNLNLGTNAAENYRAHDGCELWIVRTDNLRRAFTFKSDYIVTISGATVRFPQSGVLDELSVDEDIQQKRFGKTL